jgi:hypothetical protein
MDEPIHIHIEVVDHGIQTVAIATTLRLKAIQHDLRISHSEPSEESGDTHANYKRSRGQFNFPIIPNSA